MRFPWVRRKEYELRLENYRTLREAERVGMREDFRRETARVAAAEAKIQRQQNEIADLAKQVSVADGRVAAAYKAAELWEERCHDANADVLAARSAECPACKAKDQTVALMADVVDFERARHMTASQPLPQATSALGGTKLEPIAAEAEDRKWISDDEETVHHMLRTGQLGADLEEAAERASEMLAAIGAANTVVTSAQ